MSQQEKIIVGITGGIAAYKACEVVRGLQKAGYDPWAIMTQNATRFVTPLTFEALTAHPVTIDLWDSNISPYAHITLAHDAKAMVIAPATANCIAKIARGIADDALCSTVLALDAPLFVAPAMNEHMYRNAATQENIGLLKARGVHVIEPVEGHLACGANGMGKLPEPQSIVAFVIDRLQTVYA